MQKIITLLVGLLCLLVGLGIGIFFGPQLKTTEPVQQITSTVGTLPFAKSITEAGEDSTFEEYNYPTIKWRAKPLSDAPGGIAQLSTTYEPGSKTVKYKVTMFKAPGKEHCEVQLLDDMGFKLMQFQANDFHNIPGAPDVVEARDSFALGEDQYKKAHDYSVK